MNRAQKHKRYQAQVEWHLEFAVILLVLFCLFFAFTDADADIIRDKYGRIIRSAAVKAEFERQHSCPSTGKTKGKCPGYIVDHVNPLECGGADEVSNMQWQAIAAAKAKDKTERQCRIVR